MKTKHIIVSMLAVWGGLTACTSEEPIPGTAQNSGSVSIRFGIEATTKAADTKAEPWITPQEATINNYQIAVFDGEWNNNPECIAVFSGTTPAAPVDGTYTTEMTSLPIGKPLYFLVVANAGNVMPAMGSNYAAFEKLTTQTEAFASDKLVKIGRTAKATTLKLEATNTVTVPLTQLSARVDFLGVESEMKEEGTEETKVQDWETVDATTLYEPWNMGQKDKTNQNKQINDIVGRSVNTGGVYVKDTRAFYFNYTSGSGSNSKYKGRVLVQKKVTQTTTTSPYQFKAKATSVANVNLKSDLLIFSTAGAENTQTEVNPKNVSFSETFYTYEPAAGLTLKITGQSVAEKTTSTVTTYRVLVQTSKSGLTVSGRWPTASTNEKDWTELTDKDITKADPETTDKGDETAYSLAIPSDKLVKGNRYTVKGKYNPSVTPTITWTVERMGKADVDVPDFE